MCLITVGLLLFAGAMAGTSASVVGMAPSDFYETARKFLCAVKYLPHELTPEVSALLQDDMVKLRTEDNVSVRLRRIVVAVA